MTINADAMQKNKTKKNIPANFCEVVSVRRSNKVKADSGAWERPLADQLLSNNPIYASKEKIMLSDDDDDIQFEVN